MMMNTTVTEKFTLKNSNKPFRISYRRLLSIIFIVITVINILSMIINTALYLNRIDLKEETERHVHLPNRTNRDAYSVVRFINIISISVNISIRIFGLFAIGAMGRQFAYTEFESSDRRESFTGCLAYTCSMLILLAAYYMGIIRMVSHDLLMHSLLAILGGVFIAFSLQPHDTYSKELNQI